MDRGGGQPPGAPLRLRGASPGKQAKQWGGRKHIMSYVGEQVAALAHRPRGRRRLAGHSFVEGMPTRSQ